MTSSSPQPNDHALNKNDSLTFKSWIEVLSQQSLSTQDQTLFIQGLQNRPEWLNQTNAFQETPLIMASDHGHLDIVKALIHAGADLNVQDQWGLTALVRASCKKEPEVVQALIHAGANVNVQDQWGRTALMHAAWRGESNTIQSLIENGADPLVFDLQQKTALDFVQRSCDYELIRLLEAYSSSRSLTHVVQPQSFSSNEVRSHETPPSPSLKTSRL